MNGVEAPPRMNVLPRDVKCSATRAGNGKKIRSAIRKRGQIPGVEAAPWPRSDTSPQQVGLCVKAYFAEVGVFIQKVQEKPLKVPNNSKKGKRTSENGPIRSIF